MSDTVTITRAEHETYQAAMQEVAELRAKLDTVNKFKEAVQFVSAVHESHCKREPDLVFEVLRYLALN